jgi:opacity protein-like surface antigen
MVCCSIPVYRFRSRILELSRLAIAAPPERRRGSMGLWTEEKPIGKREGKALTSSTTNNSGWTAGVGIEWAFAGNWSVRAEYDFIGLQIRWRPSCAIPAGPLTSRSLATQDIHE